jgi:hypothetical protein
MFVIKTTAASEWKAEGKITGKGWFTLMLDTLKWLSLILKLCFSFLQHLSLPVSLAFSLFDVRIRLTEASLPQQ